MPQTQNTSQEPINYIEMLMGKLPKELQTEAMKARLTLQMNDMIMNEIGEYMSAEDLEETLKLTQEMEIPMENVIYTYVQENPELEKRIEEELAKLSEIVTTFVS